jgi:hypothetical protein
MQEMHFEPYIYLADVTDRSVLLTVGGAYFKTRKKDGHTEFKIVDDDDLDQIHPPRKQTIGASSASYGQLRVEVFDASGTTRVAMGASSGNSCWITTGLEPATEYTYKVFVDGKPWADRDLFDWSVDGDVEGLALQGGRYVNRFKTKPAPGTTAPVTFAVLGDYGRGIHADSVEDEDNRQTQIAALLKWAVDTQDVAFVLSTGDSIYSHSQGTGKEDDDWFFTFYQPYRYVINRVPVYPASGNHDDAESESSDDRAQLYDNFYVEQRFSRLVPQGRAALEDGLFYTVRWGAGLEIICLDTSKGSSGFFGLFSGKRRFQLDTNAQFLTNAFPKLNADDGVRRLPFGHHPAYCAGPAHGNTQSVIDEIVRGRCDDARIRALIVGHEHNFQYSIDGGLHQFVSGGGGSIRRNPPSSLNFPHAKTRAWGGNEQGHILLVTIDGDQMRVRPIGENRKPLPLREASGATWNYGGTITV